MGFCFLAGLASRSALLPTLFNVHGNTRQAISLICYPSFAQPGGLLIELLPEVGDFVIQTLSYIYLKIPTECLMLLSVAVIVF